MPLTLRRLDCSYAARSPLNAAAPPAKCITWVTHGSTCIGGCGGREGVAGVREPQGEGNRWEAGGKQGVWPEDLHRRVWRESRSLVLLL